MIYNYFPENIRCIVKKAIESTDFLEEIRVRCEQKITLCEKGKRFYVDKNGNLVQDIAKGIVTDKKQLSEMLRLITQNSIHAVQEEIKNGFVTLRDGSRVGLCGKCVMHSGKVEYIKEISSINIRVAREVKGCAAKIYNELCNIDRNLLIISPPGHGKTTFLRDLTRLASNGGKNISIIDERFEIAPVFDGKYIFDMGNNTDILGGSPKSLGIDMVLRTMNPQVIVVDEIATNDDINAVLRAINSGVKVFATFHGNDKDDYFSKFGQKIKAGNVFDNYIYIRNTDLSERQVWYE